MKMIIPKIRDGSCDNSLSTMRIMPLDYFPLGNCTTHMGMRYSATCIQTQEQHCATPGAASAKTGLPVGSMIMLMIMTMITW